jgi:hypothetical protein
LHHRSVSSAGTTPEVNTLLAGEQECNLADMHGDRERRIHRLQTIARLMDTAFAIPGTNIRFGADAALGLIPGAGDIVGAAIGLAIVNEARRLGVPNPILARMIINIGMDTLIGAIPILGDAFDIYFKSNRRNAQLVLEHFQTERHPSATA